MKGVLALFCAGVLFCQAAANLSVNCDTGEGRCDKRLRVVKTEGSNIELTCGFGTINIRSAFFGNAERTCGGNVAPALRICQGTQGCTVAATEANLGINTNCPAGTNVRAVVVYECNCAGLDFVELPTTDGRNDISPRNVELTTFACERQTLRITCSSGFISVLFANYGRTVSDSEQCPFQGNHNNVVTCTSPSAVTKVRNACQGKKSCEIDANNNVFTDPCVGTFKYLQVVYSCGRQVVPFVDGFFDAVVAGNILNLS